jgi:hypothetical protein
MACDGKFHGKVVLVERWVQETPPFTEPAYEVFSQDDVIQLENGRTLTLGDDWEFIKTEWVGKIISAHAYVVVGVKPSESREMHKPSTMRPPVKCLRMGG